MTNTPLQIHHGGCLCGGVRYQARGQPLVVAQCHCTDCQRTSGAGHTTGASFPLKRFEMTGRVAEYQVRSDKGTLVTRVFCPICGSSILGRNDAGADHLMINLGTLDESAEFEPQAVVFARNRKPWDIMDEGLPTSEAMENWTPVGEN